MGVSSPLVRTYGRISPELSNATICFQADGQRKTRFHAVAPNAVICA